ncbi:flagellar hook-length control protein FliK [Vibrio diazotrophicus]|uniref:flagellar hook-length control protein FliK n=1 Tax=Vibrio diazotrophicus TaxID=685 RepID=UPI0022AFDE4F|nr:flagellar hook-length control protein FliK [Vibrio diazotrophicus]MCZ4371525.1 flagellar hook-length control protein FliK [Vibrio diazotrophicus]
MNVNLTPSVETSKVTNVTKSAPEQDLVSGDNGESKGFLERLASLLLGKSDAPASSDSASEAKEVKSVEGAEVKATSTDELLSQGDDDVAVKAENGSDVSVEPKLVADEESVEVPENLKRFIASEEPEQAELKAKTAKAMDDGDKILGRLQEANQTLVKNDGKALPHEKEAELSEKSVQSKKMQSGADSELDPELVAQLNSTHPQAKSLQQEPSLKHADSEGEVLIAPETNAKKIKALSDSEQTAILAKQSKLTGANVANQDIMVAQGTDVSQNANISQPVVDAQDPSASQDTLVSKEALASVAPAAIPWGNNNTEATSVAAEINNLTEGKVAAKSVAHAAVSQALSQGVQNPQAMLSQADKAMMAQSQVPIHAEAQVQLPQANAQANPMLAGAMANQIDPTVNQAALKAGLGAKALNALMEGNKHSDGADSHLAQQLSAVAGQQGLNSPQSLRSEPLQAAQQNVPLQLSRGDMAAEQMAERVQVMLSKNLKNIDIRLDPPELGRMHIRMNMNGDGATVHFTVANQQARDALEQSMPRLREMLNNQGVQLGDTSVQQQSSGQQQRYAASGDGSGGQSASGDNRQSEENLDTNVKLDLNVAAKRDGISYYA